ncbi:DNA cytosine methyltransferase [Citromicrobium sp. WPS32]|uniref:DNA cytosine methyltransferase n=1 Tax=Citromicrobium sp. WPS32 TaxID=1634517 RepID=UPI0006DBAEDA|nr:DNA cytosine methyltransferase [Citromicrobium sp. WPS32]KPM18071.1 modification methylase [Citromicrobium sp. WPS32]MAY78293.1 DNA cytosine methyltransferase [Citromicrobium sp.]MAY78348.1 DNA cytosine methyltransferase [Citromicrobium sp.]|tara:strand:+ start:1882 stop:2946 length:1065 start_codon:yes stop_codon:yes gene_type:complete
MIRKSLQAVDLFCGIGGLSFGLESAGISVRAGIDIDPHCHHAFEHNVSGRFLERDVTSLSGTELSKFFSEDAVKLLAGCAPCQPYSTYRRASIGLPKKREWGLVEKFGALIKEVCPDLVTMENVPPLADQPVFSSLLSDLEGYHVDWDIVEMKYLGLPQTRKRLVLVASRLGPIELQFDEQKPRTVRDVISQLPAIAAGENWPGDPMHRASRLSALNLRRIKASKPGGTWRDWPADLLATCHSKPTGETFPSVYGRMEWDRPSPTITTQCFGYGNGRFGHPEQDRAISLREAAMLQGFPENYEFLPSGGQPSFASFGRLIGNAVPVPLGKAIGELFQKHVMALNPTPHPSTRAT